MVKAKVISLKEMPDDNAKLAKLRVDFPKLSPDSAQSCPVAMGDIIEYVQMESPDGERVKAKQLQFLRTALVADHRYWIWSFRESDGTDCYVTVAVDSDDDPCVGYEQNEYGLTPEQFMLGDFHQVF